MNAKTGVSARRRAREREDVREQILDAARELFVAHGIEGTTMRAIAERIEYTPTAIYHHFRDKDALLAALCDRDFRALAGVFLRIGRIDDPVERIRRIGQAYIAFGLEHPAHYRFMFMTEHKPFEPETIEHGNPDQDAYAFLRLAVREAIDAGRFRPEYADAEAVSQLLWAGVHGIVSLQIAKAKDDWVDWRDPTAVGRQLIDITLSGLAREPR